MHNWVHNLISYVVTIFLIISFVQENLQYEINSIDH